MSKKRCTCPAGWPKSQSRWFGAYGDEIAAVSLVSPPRFFVTAHISPCMLPDAPGAEGSRDSGGESRWPGISRKRN